MTGIRYSFMRACFVALWLGVFTTLNATVIRVPSQYPTIQQGLNAAQSGDTVLVASDTYFENITWPGTDGIKLRSETGPAATIIDGGNSGRVINFPNYGFSSNTGISGFTIQHGAAVQGGGIYSFGSIELMGNVIQFNTAEGSSTWVYGGGLFCDGSGSPAIEYNTFRGNICRGEYWNHGGAIYIDDGLSPLIIGNTIMQDSTIGGYWNYGAGIYCDRNTSPDIRHNVIHSNVAYGGDRGYGAGIHAYSDCAAYILSNLIYNNTARSGIWNYGAGVYVENGAAVINNTIAGNSCVGGNSNQGGGISVNDSTNFIANNIVVNNTAQSGGGIRGSASAHATLMHNDVWNNAGGDYYNISPGLNDISLDPLFVTGPLGDHYLSQVAAGQGTNSPCFDYGFASAESLQLNGYTTRTDTIHDAAVVDLGYHYPGSSWTGIYERRIEPAPEPRPVRLAVTPRISNSRFSIRIMAGSDSRGAVKLYDGLGRICRVLHNGQLPSPASDLTLTVTEDLPSGTYFVLLELADGQRFAEKLIIAR